jgi:CRP/FNR family transcriptional regulator, cyclic AMP receptor protein
MVAPLPPRFAPGSFLARLPTEQVDELLATGTRREFEAGRALMREGDPSAHVELIVRGFVKITNLVEGNEFLMGIRVPGDLVGEMAGLTGKPRVATAVSCGRVVAYVITRAAFHRFLARHPEAALHMAAVMAERLRWANERRTDYAAHSVEVRLARVLVEIADICGLVTPEGLTIGVPLSQPELATMIGVSDARIQNAFRDLRGWGLVRTGYRRLTLLDPDALRALGSGSDQRMTG